MAVKKMKKNIKIENSLNEIGLLLGIKKEDIKTILKNRKGLIAITGIIVAASIAGNLNSVCLRYLPPGPQDFAVFDKFPFSFLF